MPQQDAARKLLGPSRAALAPRSKQPLCPEHDRGALHAAALLPAELAQPGD